MEANIKVYSSFAKFSNSSLIDCENEELVLTFENLQKNLDYIVCLDRDGKKIELLIKENKITIPKDFTRLGEICIKILAMKDGLILKEYACDKLLIKRVSGEKIFVPELAEYKARVENCQKEIQKLSSNVETLTKLVSEIYGVKINLGGNE